MSSTNCQVHFIQKSGKTVFATKSLLDALGLSAGKTVSVRLGNKKASVRLKRLSKKGKHLYLPSSVRKTLHIPRKGTCHARKTASGDIQIGPLIGLMVSKPAGNPFPFGSRTGLIQSYLRAGSGKAYFFAFSPRDVNWHSETVTAYFLVAGGKWKRKIVPLPDVVYNRLASRSGENSKVTRQLKQKLERENVPLFNWSFFDKWDVYDLIRDEPVAGKHLPDSRIDPSPEELKSMLETHRFVYVKPTGGSLGRGILRLTYNPGKGYFARFRSGNRNVLLRFRKFSALIRHMNRSTGRRLKNYVVQQGIRLVELDRCPIDFRFHLNKNRKNEWVVAGIGAKKAGRGSVTTHVRTGGMLMTPEHALGRIYGSSQAENVLSQMKSATIRLAEAIERNHPHRIGELGFDMGVDRKGEIWMFEANAKPGRSIYKHPALKAQGRSTLKYVFEHCLYLSGFGGSELS